MKGLFSMSLTTLPHPRRRVGPVRPVGLVRLAFALCLSLLPLFASAQNTPVRPLRSGPEWDAQRRAFLQSFGFTPRDVVRIKALAESATATYTPRPLNDLDVAIRISACVPPPPPTMAGRALGEWRGRLLFYTRMDGPELALWKARPKGPRSVD